MAIKKIQIIIMTKTTSGFLSKTAMRSSLSTLRYLSLMHAGSKCSQQTRDFFTQGKRWSIQTLGSHLFPLRSRNWDSTPRCFTHTLASSSSSGIWTVASVAQKMFTQRKGIVKMKSFRLSTAWLSTFFLTENW